MVVVLKTSKAPMKSFYRIVVMVVVSLLTLVICGGGYSDVNVFSFIGIILVVFWGLPIIGLVTLLHFVERLVGVYARYLIALIGFIPLGLVLAFGAGEPVYTKVVVFSGLAWSAAWIVTSLLFLEKTRKQITNASSDAC
jgi:hypothetical protein